MRFLTASPATSPPQSAMSSKRRRLCFSSPKEQDGECDRAFGVGTAFPRAHHREVLLFSTASPLPLSSAQMVGFGKRVFWKRGLFRKVHVPRESRECRVLEILETPTLWKTKENLTMLWRF